MCRVQKIKNLRFVYIGGPGARSAYGCFCPGRRERENKQTSRAFTCGFDLQKNIFHVQQQLRYCSCCMHSFAAHCWTGRTWIVFVRRCSCPALLSVAHQKITPLDTFHHTHTHTILNKQTNKHTHTLEVPARANTHPWVTQTIHCLKDWRVSWRVLTLIGPLQTTPHCLVPPALLPSSSSNNNNTTIHINSCCTHTLCNSSSSSSNSNSNNNNNNNSNTACSIRALCRRSLLDS